MEEKDFTSKQREIMKKAIKTMEKAGLVIETEDEYISSDKAARWCITRKDWW